jgi:hypothetical protein
MDQLLGRGAESRAKVGEVPFRGTGSDADTRGSIGAEPPSLNERSEHIDLTSGLSPRTILAAVVGAG